MKKNQIEGVVVPVVTPVDLQDRVDEQVYRGLLRHLMGAGVHGIFVGGSAGEGPLLTAAEWERMAAIAFEECHGQVHLLGGAIDTSTKRVIERAKILVAIGYKSIVVLPTFYLKLAQPTEHLRLFGECKEALGDLNMVVYNLPSIAGSAISVEVMCEMAQRGWINCCKDSSGDMTYFARLLAEAGPLGLDVLVGSEVHASEALIAGARGMVPVSANFEPRTFVAAYESRGSEEAIKEYERRIPELVENVLLKPRLWVSGAKYAVAKMGFGSGKPVSPGEPLSTAEQRDIDSFLMQSRRDISVEMG